MKKLIVSIVALITLAGCGASSNNDQVIHVGASSVPHAEILNQIKEIVAEQGYTLKVTEFSDYVLPNTAVQNGELDANYFQHDPYLADFNAKNGTDLVSVAKVHFEPLTLYSSKKNQGTSIKDIQKGAKIAVPSDSTNEARALALLEAQGLLKLKAGVGLEATKRDIVENPYNLEIVELDAAQLVRALDDVDYAIINGNNALLGNIGELAMVSEDKNSEAAQTFGNIVAVKAGNETSEKTKVLVNALQDARISNYINESYDGFVIALQ